MEQVNKGAEDRMKKTIVALGDDFNTIRTGRASAALFESIKVEYYGQGTPLNQVATISIPEARLVVIQKSELSVNPNNDGKVIRINIPPLTEERRKEYVKLAKNKAEQSRVSIRNIRRDANEELKKLQKSSDISEDDAKRGMDDIQKVTDKYIAEINTLLEAKEEEILEI